MVFRSLKRSSKAAVTFCNLCAAEKFLKSGQLVGFSQALQTDFAWWAESNASRETTHIIHSPNLDEIGSWICLLNDFALPINRLYICFIDLNRPNRSRKCSTFLWIWRFANKFPFINLPKMSLEQIWHWREALHFEPVQFQTDWTKKSRYLSIARFILWLEFKFLIRQLDFAKTNPATSLFFQ